MIQTILVSGLEHGFYFPPYMECHNPSWRTPSFFRGVVRQPPASNDYSYFQDVDITMEVPAFVNSPPAFVDHVPFSAATDFSQFYVIFVPSFLSDLFLPFLPQKLFFKVKEHTPKKQKKHRMLEIQWSTYSFPTFFVFFQHFLAIFSIFSRNGSSLLRSVRTRQSRLGIHAAAQCHAKFGREAAIFNGGCHWHAENWDFTLK